MGHVIRRNVIGETPLPLLKAPNYLSVQCVDKSGALCYFKF